MCGTPVRGKTPRNPTSWETCYFLSSEHDGKDRDENSAPRKELGNWQAGAVAEHDPSQYGEQRRSRSRATQHRQAVSLGPERGIEKVGFEDLPIDDDERQQEEEPP